MKLKLLLFSICSAIAAQAATLTTDMFKIDYDASDRMWTDDSLQALSRTLSYWESILDYRPSTDAGKIYIDFTWDAIDEGILAGAVPGWSGYFLPPDEDTLTQIMLVSAQSKYLYNQIGGDYDGYIVFSNDSAFYFGEDECPDNLYDFETTLLQEIAHIMGIVSFYTELGPIEIEGLTYLTIWDTMLSYEGDFTLGKTINIGDPELGLTVYNPVEWKGGSSINHITHESDPDSAMHSGDPLGAMFREFSERELALYASMGMVTINIPEPCTTSLGIFALAALAYRRRRCA